MTGITVETVVDVIANPLVVLIRCSFVVSMTVNATEYGIVLGVGMTVITGCPLPLVRSAIDGELVVKLGASPVCSAVTGIAGLGEACSQVIGIGDSLILLSVAGVAIRRSTGKAPTDMATGTSHGRVGTRELESCLAVIEDRPRPLGGTVAGLTLGREPGCLVVWVCRGIIVFQVTSNARGIQACILSIDVTGRAIQRNVGTRQREPSLRMIEFGAKPLRSRVTKRAVFGKPGRHVVRIGSCVEILQMTGRTVGGKGRVLIVDVALGTGNIDMCAGQREMSGRVMVKLCSLPLSRVVASGASLREAGSHVIWAGGRVEILQMTGRTVGGKGRVLIVDVALGTGNIDVRAGQREVSGRVMVKLDPLPLSGVVANCAICREPGCPVIWAGGLIVGQLMATHTLGSGCRELSASMTLYTTQADMRAGQREVGGRVMVKLCPLPLSGVVASGTRLRETGSRMVRISGALEVLQVTGRTVGGKGRILVVHMALGTGNIDMRAGQ